MDPKLPALCNFSKIFLTRLPKFLLDHKQDLALLESPPSDVQRKILRTHDSFDKIQPLCNHGENATDIQLDVAALLLGLKRVGGRTARHKQQRAEL